VYPNCKGGDVLVPFPSNASNYSELLSWIDGDETYPAGTNKELRANGSTPIGSSIDSVREWLLTSGSSVGMGSGVLTSDTKATCREYSVILLTDGEETCSGNGSRAAEILYNLCTNGGIWDATDKRCEIANSASGTAVSGKHVRTYVIGFAASSSLLTQLNAIAAAGGTTKALAANSRSELTARLGDIIASSIPVAKCDCDSTCDDEQMSFPLKGSMCSVGVGRCKRTGQYGCNPAGDGVVCSATAAGTCPASTLTMGTPVTEVCGAASGCSAGLSAADCADDNCDGQIDENLSCQCAAKHEICNGVDDNCDGATDDVPSVTCGLNIGECKPGTTACQSGASVCQNAKSASAEICDNKDNNCDGITDAFGEECYPAATAGCTQVNGLWTCVGACQAGRRICTAGAFGSCSGVVAPSTELACDGIDNDCDGATDEGFGLGVACGAGKSGVGECRAGTLRCDKGAVVCQGGVLPSPEICDSKDNDCDGITDGPFGPCGSTLGECKAGQYQCSGANLICVQTFGPNAEICDGKDNNCDGAIDNNVTDSDIVNVTACSSSVGVCKPGVLRCIGGGKVCDGGVSAQSEVCNGLDDDCDGCIDCDPNCLAGKGKACPIPGLGTGCGLNVGQCTPGLLLCVAGTVACIGGNQPLNEVCDGKDNDCNGFTDETDPALGTGCFPAGTMGCDVAANKCVGECALGGSICKSDGAGGGVLACSNPVVPAKDNCDDKDNDCDGSTDEDFDVGVDCDNGGAGFCFKKGKKICNSRGDGTTCSAGAPQISPEICDGEDNDCDGMIDELPLKGVGEVCGSSVGECRRGISRCETGVLKCAGIEPKPEVCNGLDDDCNGSVDDGLTPPGDGCPPAGLPPGAPIVGECRPGAFICAKGSDEKWGWQCRGGVGPTTEVCDGKDNDCDGQGDQTQLCPGTSMCTAGECVPKCGSGEFPCPVDRTCKAGFCVRNPCVNVKCAAGFFCDDAGQCQDRCAGVTCAAGASCDNGICQDCFTRGCPAGQLCSGRVCVADLCLGKQCGNGSYCREGACIKSCASVTCATGQSCKEGACVADPCATVPCANGEFCDPATVTCKPRPCLLVQCLAGFACVETTGKCEANPCTGVACGNGQQCTITVDGQPQCEFIGGVNPNRTERKIGTAGGGLTNCTCHLGAGNTASEQTPAGVWMLLLGGFGIGLRRRIRHRKQLQSSGGRR